MKYKIGDRVKVIAITTAKFTGLVGTIIAIKSNNYLPYVVNFSKDKEFFRDAELELVEEV